MEGLDPLEELIARSRIVDCEWIRMDLYGDKYFVISIYSAEDHRTHRIAVEQDLARDLRTALDAFLQGDDILDLRDKEMFDRLYR